MKLNIINTSRIIRKIWQEPGISRIEIAEHLDLDRSTVTKIMNNLTRKGWITTVPKENARETVGRKPIGLAVNTHIGVILGVEVKTQNCRAVIADLSGAILHTSTHPFDPDTDTLVEAVAGVYKSVRGRVETDGKRILMMGIGIAGLIDPLEGTVKLSNPMGIRKPVALAAVLQERCGLPVLIENDANCCSWGELVYRKEMIEDSFLTILGEFRSTDIYGHREPGIAVGIGIVINGQVYYGDTSAAGEFRSVDWLPERITQFSITNERSYNISENNEALLDVFRELSRNMALVVNIFDFNRVIFTGDFARYRTMLEESLQDAVAANWVYSNVEEKHILVDFSSFEENAVAYGAAAGAISRVFSIPEVGTEKVLRGAILLETLTSTHTFHKAQA